MSEKLIRRAMALAGTLIMVACSDAGTPGEPSTGTPGSLSSSTPVAAISGGNNARHQQLQHQLDSLKAVFHANKDANKAALKAAKEEWRAWKANWNQQYKLLKEAWKRLHPGDKGGPEIQLLRCEPQDYNADAVIIGPEGGKIHVGEHELTIPRGALAEEQLIQIEAPTSALVDVRLEPHGLEFLQPALLKLSYHGCVRPTVTDFLVAYLAQGGQILEFPPSVDHKADDDVEAQIGHFSRYAVAW